MADQSPETKNSNRDEQLDRPENLLRLLVTMARNKVLDHARRQQAARRDQRRVEGTEIGLDAVADPSPSPSQIAVGRELLERVRRELSVEERALADQRALGRDWPEIAAERGATPDALRKKLTRALDAGSDGAAGVNNATISD